MAKKVYIFWHGAFIFKMALLCGYYELEGLPQALEEATAEVRDACLNSSSIDFEEADDEAARERLWRGRKGAFGAMGPTRNTGRPS